MKKARNFFIIFAVLLGLVFGCGKVFGESLSKKDCENLLDKIVEETKKAASCNDNDVECYTKGKSILTELNKQVPICKDVLENQNANIEEALENSKLQIKWLQTQIDNQEMNINLKEKEIMLTQAEIDKLIEEINIKEKKIQEAEEKLKENIKMLYEYNYDLVTIVLSSSRLSQVFHQVVYIENLQKSITNNLNVLKIEKQELERVKLDQETKKQKLAEEQKQLLIAKNILNYQKQKQEEALQFNQSTKEENEQKIKELVNQQRQILTQINDLEQKLVNVKFPPGTLGWPTNSYNRRVTQLYGCVECSSWSCPYPKNDCGDSYGFHNGLDIAPNPPGTTPEIFAADNGTVIFVGKGKYFGNWVAIKHDSNSGLITLYAHLSVVLVSPGQYVKGGRSTGFESGTGIGYMGSSGFSTGNHLHFGVYYQNFAVSGSGDPFGSNTNPLDYLK